MNAFLGAVLPVIAAPMAGAPTTLALVRAAAQAGGIGFLAGGYKPVSTLADQLTEMHAAGVPFGVNLFAPNPTPVEPAAFRRYAAEIAVDAARYGIDVRAQGPQEDDDGWQPKLDLLLGNPPPVVSFTFGLPPRQALQAFQEAGTRVVLTVTSRSEAKRAAELRPDALAVQSSDAGGHSGTFTPAVPVQQRAIESLLADVREVTDLPLIAAGGIGTAERVRDVIAAGAAAVMVGTALLRTDESGAGPAQRRALTEDRGTVVTRAFTGRPARALRNDFTERHSFTAPLGYPAIHHLTSGMRAGATKAGDGERINLWAGTEYRLARAGSAAAVVTELARLL
jgi:nitronate monooxygenase